MQEKLVVQFTKLPVYSHQTDYMAYCKSCHSYHINNQNTCHKCGSRRHFVTIDAIAKKTVRQDFYNRSIIILMVCLALFLVSMTFSSIVYVSFYTIGCLLLNVFIYIGFKNAMITAEFEKHLTLNVKKIKKDLYEMLQKAQDKMEQKSYLDAYEDLRYLGMLIDGPQLRLQKINCLRHFRLRKDLPLEMKEVLLEECNQYLIYYIYEVAMLKKELIDEATIKYILKYKEEVLNFKEGEKIVAQVIGATLKSKMMTKKYAHLIYEYIDYFPKDRLIRLCKIKECISDITLLQQITDKIRLKYGHDEAFTNYL